jgi:TolB-like protein
LKKNILIHKITLTLFIFMIVLMGSTQTIAITENIKTIAVLPFKINAPEKLIHVQKGLGRMLYSRLSWNDNVVVIPQKELLSYLSGTDGSKAGTDKVKSGKGIREIARLTHSDFVLTGAITKLGGSFSIDVQVYDIENKRYMAFFDQSQKSGDLIDKTNRIAATINKKIFGRSTLAWEKMEQEQKADVQKQIRKNPEYMMKTPGWQDAEKSPGWKIWKYIF